MSDDEMNMSEGEYQEDIEEVEDDVDEIEDDEEVIESSSIERSNLGMEVDGEKKPRFAPLSAQELSGVTSETRKIAVPPHRYTPLKENWLKIYTPIVEHMKLQVRMNLQTRRVEIRTSELTEDQSALQKAADFVRAFMLGFDVDDALALLRLDDLYIDSFEIKDVKTLQGDHLSRAIGRVAGKDGKTKFTIENVSRTRIVLAETHIHILGSFQNIKIARDALVSLILGSPPGKVYAQLRAVASRMSERF